MVRAVLFDLFETLVTESRTRPAGVSSLAHELGCERAAFRAQWKALRPAVTTGRVTFRQALTDITARLGGRAEEATLQRLCDARIRIKAEPFAEVDEQVLAGLDHLRSRHVRLGVISNGFAEDVTAWSGSALASRVDCTVFSCEVGLAKPDPGIYLEAASRLSVAPAETWYIGDGGDEELAGATRAGLRAFRALWFLARWPHFREEPHSPDGLPTVQDLVMRFERQRVSPTIEPA